MSKREKKILQPDLFDNYRKPDVRIQSNYNPGHKDINAQKKNGNRNEVDNTKTYDKPILNLFKTPNVPSKSLEINQDRNNIIENFLLLPPNSGTQPKRKFKTLS